MHALTREPIHPMHAPEIIRLRGEVEALREEVRQFRDEFGAVPGDMFIVQCKAVLGLSASRAKLLSILLEGRARSNGGLLLAYSDGKRERPDVGLIKTLVANLRTALAPHGITIDISWGHGYFMTPEAREKVRALLGVVQG